MTTERSTPVSHALDRIDDWRSAWKEHGRLTLLLDFDGTLAPIVARPEMAALPPGLRAIIERLAARSDVDVAVVSGRGLQDARSRVGVEGIAYAGNHGMEIDAPGVHRVHPAAAAARPSLERVIERVSPALRQIEGVLLEDKDLTLTVHFRQAARDRVGAVERIVRDAVGALQELRVTEGKEVLEVRPAIDWHKGRAVDFLLDYFDGPAGGPVLYLGDDRTDEDAFRALAAHAGGAGVVVAEPPPEDTTAVAYLRSTEEVMRMLDLLAEAGPRD